MFCPGPGSIPQSQVFSPSTGLAESPSIRDPVSYPAAEGNPIHPWPFQMLLGSQAEFTMKLSQENHHYP